MIKDLRQTKGYAHFLSQIGWIVEKKSGIYFYIKKLPLIGSAIKLQRTDTIPFKTLQELATTHKAFQIIIEPNEKVKTEQLKKAGFVISKTPYLPTKTQQIDISKTKSAIIAQMKKDARYSLRKSEKVQVYHEESIEAFRKAWKAVVKNKRHVLPLTHLHAFKKAFGGNMLLLTNREKTAGAMFLKADKVAYYWIGFTSKTARNSLVQYQIIWSGIQWAKKRKAKVFDFEGIYDARFPLKGWEGFTHFKKSFGGKEIVFPGSFMKWRLPMATKKV